MTVGENWRDFRFTLSVVAASAQAEADLQEDLGDAGRLRLEFRLMAAAATEQPVLPRDGWADRRRLMTAQVSEQPGELRLGLQAEGFEALRQVAGRTAVVRAENGAIEQHCTFDANGSALVVLADTPEVRDGLAAFAVLVTAG